MLKYCRDKWDKNKDKLEAVIMTDTKINTCRYEYLVKLIVEYILNPSTGEEDWEFDSDAITVIDNGDYQGTMLFVIPRKRYQPNASEHILTFSEYGSCDCCDTLMSIQDYRKDLPTENQVKEYMALCKDLVCNIVKPYNYGWREDERFTEIAE